jgi:Protein of unknown function (DUF998)
MTEARTGHSGLAEHHSGLAEHPYVDAVGQDARRLASAAARLVRTSQPIPAWAVASACLTPVLLTAAWLIAGSLQPASYSPMRQTVSVLAGRGGTDRWLMTGALFVVGACCLVTAAGVSGVPRSARVLLAIAGVASFGVAACPEPVHGSTPQHLAWTALGEVAIAIWPAFIAGRGSSGTALLSVRGCIIMTAVSIALLGWLVVEAQGGSALGLAERLSSSVQTSWPMIVILAMRRTPATNATSGALR